MTEYETFTRLVDRVLAVPHSEIVRREAEYKKQSQQNPHRRGPKPKQKVKPSASGRASRA